MTVTTERSSIADSKAEFGKSAVRLDMVGVQDERSSSSLVAMVAAQYARIFVSNKNGSTPLSVFRTINITSFRNATTPKMRLRTSPGLLSHSFNRFWRSSLTDPCFIGTEYATLAGIGRQLYSAIAAIREAVRSALPSWMLRFIRVAAVRVAVEPWGVEPWLQGCHTSHKLIFGFLRRHLISIRTGTAQSAPVLEGIGSFIPDKPTLGTRCQNPFLRILWHLVIITLCVGMFTGQASAISVKTELLQSCAAACNGDGTIINVSSYTTAVIQVCCTFTATVNFETSIDGTNYDAVECFSTADKTSRTVAPTVRGQWRCNMIGMNKLKARISGYASGTMLVTAGLASAGVY
jgi:hypothetical protein